MTEQNRQHAPRLTIPYEHPNTKMYCRLYIERLCANGAIKSGVPTQGIFAHDSRLVDNYSGPASSLSVRAVNIALYSASRNGLWQAE